MVTGGTDDEVRDRVFTFGYGQRLIPLDSSGHLWQGVEGISLADGYVIVRGTRDQALQAMLLRFGRVWSSDYPDAEAAGVERYVGMWQVLPPIDATRDGSAVKPPPIEPEPVPPAEPVCAMAGARGITCYGPLVWEVVEYVGKGAHKRETGRKTPVCYMHAQHEERWTNAIGAITYAEMAPIPRAVPFTAEQADYVRDDLRQRLGGTGDLP